MRYKGLRKRLLAKPPYPPMHDGKSVSVAILMTDAFSRQAADDIDDVGRTFNGMETVPLIMPE